MTEYNVDDALDMNNYSINQIDAFFKANNCEVHCSTFGKTYGEAKWNIILKKKDDGIGVEITTSHTSLYSALYDAYEKFKQVANRGAPNLLAPMIESKVSDAARPSGTNDDIPF